MYQEQLPNVNPFEIDLNDDFSFFEVPPYDPWIEPLFDFCDCCHLHYPVEELRYSYDSRICCHCE
jgi:hypothetical protein